MSVKRQLARPCLDAGDASLRASDSRNKLPYVVSDSGGVFSLGEHYRVSSTGTVSTAYSLDVTGTAPRLQCKHISELDFEHARKIGKGSSSKVFDVVHNSGTHVCVKEMSVTESRQREEIKRELDMLHHSSSRWIVDFFGAFFNHECGNILLLLELMDASLLDIMHLTPKLSELQAKAFVFQILSGLDYVHNERHLVHRDIKPANILVNRQGQVKITDFGVSSGQRSQDPTSVHTFVGSVLYMSPERLEGRSYSYDADIWSLGITVFEAVTGRHPHQESGAPPLGFWDLLQKVLKNPKVHDESFTPELQDFVDGCLAFDRENRATDEMLMMHPWLEGMTTEISEKVVAGLVQQVIDHRELCASSSAGPTPKANTPAGQHPAYSPQALTPEENKAKGFAMLDGLLKSTAKK